MTTSEGHHWNPSTSLTSGLPTLSHHSSLPSTTSPSPASSAHSYDVIVIGAGYAGLIAARDLTARHHSVLLLEARDRIGGRTWTSEIDGFKYEMGGTWVHWKQPHVYAELSRYGMKDQLTPSQDYSSGINCFSWNAKSEKGEDVRSEMGQDKEEELYASAMTKFFEIDGQMGRRVMPFPHDPFSNRSEAEEWDKVSLADRLVQLRGQLTEDEEIAMTSLACHMSGGTVSNTGFFDLLRWWALCDYKPEGVNEYGLALKLKCGQTGLAREIYADAVETEFLSAKFEAPVTHISESESDGVVTVTTASDAFKARKVICTIPLNVLHETTFESALPAGKVAASKTGHIDMAPKIHYEISGPELKSWSGMSWPGKGLLYAYGDSLTPAGNTHVVAFGAAETHLDQSSIPDLRKAVQEILPGIESEYHVSADSIQRIVYHDWVKDPYARGAWCVFSTGFATKYLKILQERHGNVIFAGADWADGWRGFIDGAVEQGMRAARVVDGELRGKGKAANGVAT